MAEIKVFLSNMFMVMFMFFLHEHENRHGHRLRLKRGQGHEVDMDSQRFRCQISSIMSDFILPGPIFFITGIGLSALLWELYGFRGKKNESYEGRYIPCLLQGSLLHVQT